MAGTERGEWREAGKEAKGPENAVTAALEDLLLSKMGRDGRVQQRHCHAGSAGLRTEVERMLRPRLRWRAETTVMLVWAVTHGHPPLIFRAQC